MVCPSSGSEHFASGRIRRCRGDERREVRSGEKGGDFKIGRTEGMMCARNVGLTRLGLYLELVA